MFSSRCDWRIIDGDTAKVFILAIVIAVAIGCTKPGPHQVVNGSQGSGGAPKPGKIGFNPDIVGIVRERCTPCHTSGGGLDWTQYSNLAARAKSGVLQRRITSTGSGSMPPSGNPELSQIQKEKILAWIDSGAPERANADEVPGEPPTGPLPPENPPPATSPIANCVGCHGDVTNTNLRVPLLAGQRADYLEAQLKAFAANKRTDLVMGAMNGIAAGLKSDEIRAAALFYQGLHRRDPRENFSGDRDRARKQAGACMGCHLTSNGDSADSRFPNIKWQNKEYLRDQLLSFKKGSRTDFLSGGIMKSLAEQMSVTDIDLLALYFQLFDETNPSPVEPEPIPPPPDLPEPPIENPDVTYWKDVRPIVLDKCVLCHRNPPLNWLDYMSLRERVLSGVLKKRIFDEVSGRMPPPNVPQLTPRERSILRRWIELRGPEGRMK